MILKAADWRQTSEESSACLANAETSLPGEGRGSRPDAWRASATIERVDRFELLAWLIEREQHGLHSPAGLDLLEQLGRDGVPWEETVRAADELLGLSWVEGRFLAAPGQKPPPAGAGLTSHELQQYQSLRVTERGYSVHRAKEPAQAGHTFNISNSQIGQLAAGDINNVTIENLLVRIEETIDAMDAPEADKQEARETVSKMRQLAESVGGSAAGGVIAAALRGVLGLP